MPKKHSRFDKRLRALGLKPIAEFDPEAASGESTDPWDMATDALQKQQEELLAGLSRDDRRRALAARASNFIRFGDYTQAWDEHGQEWMGNCDVDLAPLGFRDCTPEMVTMMRDPKAKLH